MHCNGQRTSTSFSHFIGAADKALGNKEGWAEFKFKTPEQGVATHVYGAFHPDIQGTFTPADVQDPRIKNPGSRPHANPRTAKNGAYLQDGHVADPCVETVKPWATSSVEAERLWKLSEKLVGQEFAY